MDGVARDPAPSWRHPRSPVRREGGHPVEPRSGAFQLPGEAEEPGFVSEAGMYADIKAASGVEAPAMLGTVPAEKVADEVLRAIVENDPEVIVNATPLRPMVMASSLMPRLGDWLAQKSGAVDVFKKSARKPDREA